MAKILHQQHNFEPHLLASISAQLKPSNHLWFLMSWARPLSMPIRRAGLRSSNRPIRSCGCSKGRGGQG